jgi:hypothetical protein
VSLVAPAATIGDQLLDSDTFLDRACRWVSGNTLEVAVWNHFISSRYAHFAAAVSLTLALVVVFLTGNPGKSRVAQSDASVHGLQWAGPPGPQLSDANSDALVPTEAFFDYSLVFPEHPDSPDAR